MKITSGSSVGGEIRRIRLEMGMRLDHLADELGISMFKLSRIESGTGGFDTSLVPRMPATMRDAVKMFLAGEVNAIPDRPMRPARVRRGI